jgi:hypothetical protein
VHTELLGGLVNSLRAQHLKIISSSEDKIIKERNNIVATRGFSRILELPCEIDAPADGPQKRQTPLL